MRVLIVEDEPDLASFLSSLLLGAGLVVDRVGATEEAFQALENAPFDVSIVDRRLLDSVGSGTGQVSIRNASGPPAAPITAAFICAIRIPRSMPLGRC